MGSNSIEEPEHSLMIEETGFDSTRIYPQSSRFPCCIVWSPLPVLSWFIPCIGHIGICRENGVILDFAGPNFVCVDNFAFGAPTRYIQLTKEQCCVFLNVSEADGEKDVLKQSEEATGGINGVWDDALHRSTQEYQHHSYNLLTCNCHSFVANCLNRLKFETGGWNVVNLAVLIFFKGSYVSNLAVAKTYLPFIVVSSIGFIFGGLTYFAYLGVFFSILVGWFLLGTYCFKKLIHI